jgi:hypothetical protein
MGLSNTRKVKGFSWIVQVNLKIVFCHLNVKVPSYLRANLETTANRFPHLDIYLITNQVNKKFRGKNIHVYQLQNQIRISNISDNLSHPKNFRNDFWSAAIARFAALSEFAKAFPGPGLHVESDVVLLKNFPTTVFQMLEENLAYPIVAENRGVASTLFYRDYESIEDLAKYSIDQSVIEPDTTDMVILANYFKLHPNKVVALPYGSTDPKAYSDETPIELLKSWRNSVEKFQGVFDGNDIGTYLFGTDPRNRRGTSVFRSKIRQNYALIENWKFDYSREEKAPYIVNSKDKTSITIFSAHITNKRLIYFHHSIQNLSIMLQVKKSAFQVRHRFYATVFTKHSVNYLSKRLGLKKS